MLDIDTQDKAKADQINNKRSTEVVIKNQL